MLLNPDKMSRTDLRSYVAIVKIRNVNEFFSFIFMNFFMHPNVITNISLHVNLELLYILIVFFKFFFLLKNSLKNS